MSTKIAHTVANGESRFFYYDDHTEYAFGPLWRTLEDAINFWTYVEDRTGIHDPRALTELHLGKLLVEFREIQNPKAALKSA